MNGNMEREIHTHPKGPRTTAAKVVAEIPEDKNVEEKLKDWKENDAYPGSCGI